jgi:hypothetical protein
MGVSEVLTASVIRAMIMEAVTEKLVSFYDTARFMSLSMSMG